MIAFLQGLLLVVLVGLAAALVGSRVLPTSLRVIARMTEDVAVVAAGVLLLPEYWISTGFRSRGARPPLVAYEYGAAVAGAVIRLQQLCGLSIRQLARLAEALPPPITGAVAAVTTALLLLA
ncbi:hypothetical protein GCM10010472_71780 [Pseudonocardia halophobica]|uniref:Uncharacterized protein n=1 Tax=Pseudonocardia halophobica TaxID=29401 RepID=A0A9W6L181_9PSEU|nr:hypothetical protein [Pseudonocardia halophobica]GLL10950.1 hypothetical protein GCM10017577_20910 [Pseudonocardia halophobica]